MQNEINTTQMPRVNDDEMTIDLLELARELLRRWVIIALATVVAASAAFGYTKFMVTPMYEATSQLYVLSKSTSITSLADVQMGANLTNDYKVVVSGRPILDQVIANLGLNETYGSLKSKVTLNNPTNSRILEIKVKDSNPKRAKAIADEIAVVSAAFISEKMDQDPPSVIQFGYDDEGQVSPSLKKNVLIGGLAGAVVSCALIVFVYLINDTVNTPEDVEKKLGLRTIAQIPFDTSEDDKGRKIKRSFRMPRIFRKKKKKYYGHRK